MQETKERHPRRERLAVVLWALSLSILIWNGSLGGTAGLPNPSFASRTDSNPVLDVRALPAVLGSDPSSLAASGLASPTAAANPPVEVLAPLGPFAVHTGPYGYVAGGAAMRNQGYGTITVTWTGTLVVAYLVWGYMADSIEDRGTVNGIPVSGSVVASGPNPCWTSTIHTVVADVTGVVVNGANVLTDFSSGVTTGEDPWSGGFDLPLLEGASLIVIFDDGGPEREISLHTGADTIASSSTTLTESFPHIAAGSADGKTTFVVSDGQFPGNDARWDSIVIDIEAFPGADPRTSTMTWSYGNLWDTNTYPVTIGVGSTMNTGAISNTGNTSGGDCLTWHAQVLEVTVDPGVGVDDPPIAVAQASPTVSYMGDLITFDGSASTDDLGIVAYEWAFGDGWTDATAVTYHAYGARGSFSATLTVWDTIGQSDTDSVLITIVNRDPIADAGPDQTTTRNVLVTLDGTLSRDPDGDPLTFSWNQLAGPPTTLSGETTPNPTFTPTSLGVHTFLLSIIDGWGGASNDPVDVTVGNQPPTADAGADAGTDQSVFKGSSVGLDGSASFDPDGDPLTFSWTQVAGPTVVLSGAGTANPEFVVTASGVHAFSLVVTDPSGASSEDSVSVQVTNRAPLADAGIDASVPKKLLATLDGSGSSDPDGDPLSYFWSQTGGPTVSLSGANTANPAFTPPSRGTYSFHLRVDDGDGAWSEDVVVITAWGRAPVARLVARPASAGVGEPIAFDGSSSSDPDGAIVNFAFAFGDGVHEDGAPSSRNHTFPRPGLYTVTLTVIDDDGNASAPTIVRVVVRAPPVSVSVNWKPLVAAVFAALLVAAGAWSSRRNPTGHGGSVSPARAFARTSLPFILAEAATGVASYFTGFLSIPPILGLGLLVDGAILTVGVGIALARGRTRTK